MNRISLALIALMLLQPIFTYAQTTPQAPASWIAFRQQENAKRMAFLNELKAEKDAFINANPDVKAYLEEMRVTSKERMNAWRAAHPRKNTLN